MKIIGIKTTTVMPGDDLLTIIDKHLPTVTENTIVAITSKVISFCENRLVKKSSIKKKYDLVKKEADFYLAENQAVYDTHLTIKYQRLIPSAGIDESNANGHYILYPVEPQQTAEKLWQHLRKKHKIKKCGVMITDSQITPLRSGVTGACIGWCGFKPLYDYRNKKDLFKRTLRMTQINLLDALSASAVLVMGEGDEQTPIAIIENAPKITFLNRLPTSVEKNSIAFDPNQDLFSPLLNKVKWRTKMNG